MTAGHPYEQLTPDVVLTAVEQCGWRCDGRMLALNSYENRVYQLGIEDGPAVVVKFYRPERWSDAAILEEHAFTLELAEHELPVVAPMVDAAGHTLHEYAGFRFAVYPRCGGRPPELDDLDHLEWLGRFIGRIHAVGAVRPFVHRPELTVQAFGQDSLDWLMEHEMVAHECRQQYRDLAGQLLTAIREAFAIVPDYARIRLHGDCHAGNVLWTDRGPHFVDLDDCRSGPAVQDLWMLLSGDRSRQLIQLDAVLTGYSEFCDFDPRELRLIESLRSLRLLHYAAWLARRWSDPAFPRAFPWFNTVRYWEEQILILREQLIRLDDPPLRWGM